MSDETQVDELLLRWETLKNEGQEVSIETLCRDCPKLIPALQQKIEALQMVDRLLVSAASKGGGTLQPAEENSVLRIASTDETQDVKAKSKTPSPEMTAPPGESARSELRPDCEPVPGYRLVGLLGRGGFGEVWKAMAPGGFPIAMKFVVRSGQRERIETRALEILKGIRHPNLLATFGAWQIAGWLVIAMELADRTLNDRFEESRDQGQPGIPRDELLEYLEEAAKGIDYLNEPQSAREGKQGMGVQHRDIKPQNILLVGRGVKVADFGLARLLEHAMTAHTGSLTPGYAAPEFIRGQTSNRSDQYSLAVTYCELRGGRLPFEGNVEQVLLGHLEGTPNLSMLPEDERPVVARAMAKNPNDRWPSCRAFVEALAGQTRAARASVPHNRAPDAPQRRRFPAFASIVLVAVFALIMASILRRKADVALEKWRSATNVEPQPADAGLGPQPQAGEVVAPIPASPPAAARETVPSQPADKTEVSAVASPDKSNVAPTGPERVAVEATVSPPTRPPALVPDIAVADAAEKSVTPAAPPAPAAMADIRREFPVGELVCFQGHTGGVRSVAASPDGHHVLSAGDDKCVRLWEMKSGIELHCFAEHTATVHSVAFSPDGFRAISGSEDRVVWLWDITARSKLRALRGHTDDVYCVAVSSDGSRALTAGKDTTVRLWNLETGEELSQFSVRGESIWSMAIGPEDRRVLMASDSRVVRLYDVDSGSVVKQLGRHSDVVWSVSWSAKSGRAVSGGGDVEDHRDFSVRVWDVEQGIEIHRLVGHRGAVGSVALSPDGRRALSGSADMTVRLWDLQHFQELHCFTGHTGIMQCVTFSPDGRRAISASRDGTVRVWGLPE